MKGLIVSATPFELAPLRTYLETHFQESAPGRFTRQQVQVDLLITGVGLPLAAFALGHHLSGNTYDLAVQLGVAGSFERQWPLGTLVQVQSECFADLGVEEADGYFTAATQMGLIAPDQWPFREGRLWQPNPPFSNQLPTAHSISVNTVSGTQPTINARRMHFPEAQIESMEGAAFFYACLLREQAMLQIRSLSNYVTPRNRDHWELSKAIQSLNTFARGMVESWLEV